MKKVKALFISGILALSTLTGYHTIQVHAREANAFVEPTIIRATCYNEHGTTASGQETRQGIVAGRKEWLGYVACINKVNPDGTVGEFIGYFEFTDTGAGIDSDGDGKGDTIRTGNSIDIWVEDDEAVRLWQKEVGDYVYIKIIKGVG